MKKIVYGFISLILIFTLTGCGSSKEIDLTKVYNSLHSDFDGYVKVDDKVLEGNYDIDLTVFKDYMVVMNETGATSKMYAIFEAGDSYDDASDEVSYFISKYKESWDNNYFPDETKAVNDSVLEKYGNYFIYVVSSNPDDIISKIEAVK